MVLHTVVFALFFGSLMNSGLQAETDSSLGPAVRLLGPVDFASSDADGDGDGVLDQDDRCPNTPKGKPVWKKEHLDSHLAQPAWIGCSGGEIPVVGQFPPNGTPRKLTHFETLDSFFKRGTTFGFSEVEGMTVGRCFNYNRQNSPVAAILYGEQRNDTGPAFPPTQRLGAIQGSEGVAPDTFDEITSEEQKEFQEGLSLLKWDRLFPVNTSQAGMRYEISTPCFSDDQIAEFKARNSPPAEASQPTSEEITYAMNIRSMQGVAASRSALGMALGGSRSSERESHRIGQVAAITNCVETRSAELVKYGDYIISKNTFLRHSHPQNVIVAPGSRRQDNVDQFCYYFKKVHLP